MAFFQKKKRDEVTSLNPSRKLCVKEQEISVGGTIQENGNFCREGKMLNHR